MEMIFDTTLVPAKNQLNILEIGNYFGEIEEITLLEEFENGNQKYMVTCLADGANSRYQNWWKHVEEYNTNQGWSMLTQICNSVGITADPETGFLPDLHAELPGKPIAFQVGHQVTKDENDEWVKVTGDRKDGSKFFKTKITAFARSLNGLPKPRQ